VCKKWHMEVDDLLWLGRGRKGELALEHSLLKKSREGASKAIALGAKQVTGGQSAYHFAYFYVSNPMQLLKFVLEKTLEFQLRSLNSENANDILDSMINHLFSHFYDPVGNDLRKTANKDPDEVLRHISYLLESGADTNRPFPGPQSQETMIVGIIGQKEMIISDAGNRQRIGPSKEFNFKLVKAFRISRSLGRYEY
jgi:hypothetical protein